MGLKSGAQEGRGFGFKNISWGCNEWKREY